MTAAGWTEKRHTAGNNQFAVTTSEGKGTHVHVKRGGVGERTMVSDVLGLTQVGPFWVTRSQDVGAAAFKTPTTSGRGPANVRIEQSLPAKRSKHSQVRFSLQMPLLLQSLMHVSVGGARRWREEERLKITSSWISRHHVICGFGSTARVKRTVGALNAAPAGLAQACAVLAGTVAHAVSGAVLVGAVGTTEALGAVAGTVNALSVLRAAVQARL